MRFNRGCYFIFCWCGLDASRLYSEDAIIYNPEELFAEIFLSSWQAHHDCSLYFDCENIQVVIRRCPAGLHSKAIVLV